jgi:hypothetical protein
MARMTDLYGRPRGDLLDLTGGMLGFLTTGTPETVWNGEEFVLFWTRVDSRKLHMTRVPRDHAGGPLSVQLVTDNVGGARMGVSTLDVAWVGDGYVLALAAGGNAAKAIVMLKVDRDGVPRDDGFRYDEFGHGWVRVATGANKMIVAWLDSTTVARIWFMFVDPATGEMLPPGRTELHASRVFTTNTWLMPVAWTGEMFAIAVDNRYYFGEDQWEYWMWRVLPSGAVLDPEGILLSAAGPRSKLCDLVWAGNELWSLHLMKTGAMQRGIIACACVDADGDGRNACHDDCDDGDPTVARTKPEICIGGKDDDCDGLTDCADSDCPIRPGPGEVTGVRHSGGALVWDARAGALRYAVARGLLSDLVRRGDMVAAECPAPETTATTWPDDGRKPPPGDALWYLVRAEGTPCSLGGWGAEPLRASVGACD